MTLSGRVSPQIRFLFANQHFYLCRWIATTSAPSDADPEAEDETDSEAKVEAEGETQGQPEAGVGGPKGETENATTTSDAEQPPAGTHEQSGAPRKGVESSLAVE